MLQMLRFDETQPPQCFNEIGHDHVLVQRGRFRAKRANAEPKVRKLLALREAHAAANALCRQECGRDVDGNEPHRPRRPRGPDAARRPHAQRVARIAMLASVGHQFVVGAELEANAEALRQAIRKCAIPGGACAALAEFCRAKLCQR